MRLVVADGVRGQGLVPHAQLHRNVAVATNALRDARNRENVARRVAAAAGVPVRILSGEEEAALGGWMVSR